MKNNIIQFLLKNNHGGVIHKGAYEAVEAFGVHTKTIYKLWKAAAKMMKNGEPAIMVGKESSRV